MANSILTYPGSAGFGPYAATFTLGKLRDAYVQVRVNEEVDGLDAPLYRDIEWISDTLFNITSGTEPTGADEVTVLRTIPDDVLIHDYSNGAVINEENLDESNLQTIMLVHQFLDGRLTATIANDLDMGGHKIINLGDGTEDGDAVNYSQIAPVLEDFANIADSVERAETAADSAEADAQQTAADRVQTGLDRTAVANDKATVAADKAIVAADKATVAVDKGIVAADKAIVAADKATTLGYRNETEGFRDEAEGFRDEAEGFRDQADADATQTALDRIQTGADRVQTGIDASTASAAAIAAQAAASAVANQWNFDTSTTMADPGSTDIRFNNATIASVTQIAVSATSNDTGNPDLSDYITTWDDSTHTPKGLLNVRTAAGDTAQFGINGAVTDNGTWLQIPVAFIAGTATLSAGEDVYISFSGYGNDGTGTGDAERNSANTFTAANTFSANGAASLPALSITGIPFSGGTGTTTFPLILYQNSGATPATNWNTSGTILGMNSSSSSGNFIDYKVNGTTKFSVEKGYGDVTAGSFNGSGNITGSGTGTWAFYGRTKMTSPADGYFQLTNNAGNGFTGLRLGGSSTSFPMIKRNSTAINIRLADDSADADLTFKTQTAGDNSTKGATTAYADAAAKLPFRTTSSTTTLVAGDKAGVVELTGSTDRTWDATAVATLGANWSCFVHNNSTAILTFDPNSSEQVDSLTTLKMYPGELRRICVNAGATAFETQVINGFIAVFDSSGSFTVPPGYSSLQVDIISGGAAGASRSTTGNGGGGGGGALYSFNVRTASLVAAGSNETVTVAATAAGVTGNTAGTNGNSSAFTINGVTVTVNGGIGGATAAAGAAVNPAQSGVPAYIETQWTFIGAAAGGGKYSPAGASLTGATSSISFTDAAVGGNVTAGNVPAAGGNSLHGGGGGGGCSSTAGGVRTGGTSVTAGAGGAGGANTGGAGTNGTAPGGGGGAAVQGGTSGSGAPGRVIIRGIL